MSNFRLPLSGDVNQTINPWNWYFNGNQFGLFNINLGKTKDPVVEQEILDSVGTYGRQLGRIGDVLRILLEVDKERLSTLSEKDLKAIEELKEQLQYIERIKKDNR